MSHICDQLNTKLLFNRSTENLLYIKLMIMHALISFLVYCKGHSNEIQRSYITIVYFTEEKPHSVVLHKVCLSYFLYMFFVSYNPKALTTLTVTGIS